MSDLLSTSGKTRREALLQILLISAGTCTAFFGASKIIYLIPKPKAQDSQKGTQVVTTAPQGQTPGNNTIASISSTLTSGTPTLANTTITIKVAYFGFQTVQTTGVSEEYLTLTAPAFLQDVLSKVREEHPVLGPMIPIMAITINGIPEYGNPQLANNSEVDFIPMYAGG